MLTDRRSDVEDIQVLINMGDGNTVSVARHSDVAINAGTDREEYKWEYTFGADGNYTVSWNGVNRNANILNVAAPSADLSFYIATTVDINSLRTA